MAEPGKCAGLALLLLLAPAVARARAPAVDTVFVALGAHLDIGFTDTPRRVIEQRIATLDAALDAAAADPSFRWIEEGGVVFERWRERHRADASRLALARRLLADGQLGVGATWLSPHVAAVPEAMPLLTLHLGPLVREFGYRAPVAVINDTPSQPEALVDALAASGVRYLLVGANMFLTSPLPARLVRSPFWWESAKGARVLVYVDPAGYLPAAHWPADADTTAFADTRRFPHDRRSLAVLQAGIHALVAGSDARYDALVMQHAPDNGGVRGAVGLPAILRLWNEAGLRPRVVLSTGVEYFRHIERLYGSRLPVYRGEWGGQWDFIRAASPVWTWRLRQAAQKAVAGGTRAARAAVATALDHNLVLGTVRPGMTLEQYRDHTRQCAEIYGDAVRLSLGRAALAALPPVPASPPAGPLPAEWSAVLAPGLAPRLRAGPQTLQPFIAADAAPLEAPVHAGGDASHLAITARLNRARLPGTRESIVCAVLEVPLRARAEDVRLAPLDSPSALAGHWLRGAPPGTVVAARGLRVSVGARTIRVRSPLISSWSLATDPRMPGVAWLQGLVARESDRCEVDPYTTLTLPFAELYPGEPQTLDVSLELTWGGSPQARQP